MNVRSGGVLSQLSATTVPCRNNMVVRSVVRTGQLFAYVDGVQYVNLATTGTTFSSTQPGVGAFATPTGNSMSNVSFGPLDRVVPSAINPSSVGVAAFPATAELQWPAAADDANGSGLLFYTAACQPSGGSSTITASSYQPYLFLSNLQPSTSYTCQLAPVDYHGNGGTAASISINTPAANGIDARRTGLRPTGSYWGALGEQIDTRSGNLNFSIPLLQPQSRGWGLTLSLTVDTQIWRQDSGGLWQKGYDNGYRYGWHLQLGSLLPVAAINAVGRSYVFTDATGAQYQFTPANPASPDGRYITTEGLHLSYDEAAKRLSFPTGMVWTFGAQSAIPEADAGTLYPTLAQDSNGNQITVRYLPAAGGINANTSGRISEIEDVRAVANGANPRRTYSFAYNTLNVNDPIPHLTGITSYLNNSENYSFNYNSQPLLSPFTPSTNFGYAVRLASVSVANAPLSWQMQYDSSGSDELSQVTLPAGGQLRWDYRPFSFTGGRTIREVSHRYLKPSAGASEATFTFSHDDSADASNYSHGKTNLADPSGNGYTAWIFNTDGTAAPAGLLTGAETRQTAAGSVLRSQSFSWTTDGSGNAYVNTALTTLDPGTANQQQAKTEQTRDLYGNVTQLKQYHYNSLATPARTYTNTYVTDPAYLSRFLQNRLLSSTVTNGATTITLVSNVYDQYTGSLCGTAYTTALTNRPGITEFDSANYGTGFSTRGNLTSATSPGQPTRCALYDITGLPTRTLDAGGRTTSYTPASNMNNAVLGTQTPFDVAGFATTTQFGTAFFAPTQATGPNGAATQMSYDSLARPQMFTSAPGASTSYSYGYNPMTTTATVSSNGGGNGRWTRTTRDGLGRPVKRERGDTSGTKHAIDTTYGYAANSPLGVVATVSRPYAPGNTVYSTGTTYDALGRVTAVARPNSAGSATNQYSGNQITRRDPSNHWKRSTYDAMGRLAQLTEPDPGGGADHQTAYTYDLLDRMTGVSMPRSTTLGMVTQTRSFNYDPATQRLMSMTHPESGTTSFTYNADGTVATRSDAKGQSTHYSYDSYKRLNGKQRWAAGASAADPCQSETYQYDTNPYEPAFGANLMGRLTARAWGGTGCTGGAMWQMYGYTSAGLLTSHRLRVDDGLTPRMADLDAAYGYNTEGQRTSITNPGGSAYTTSHDSLGRVATVMNGSTMVGGNAIYGPANELLQLSYPNFGASGTPLMTEVRQYNLLGQLTRFTISPPSPGAAVLDVQYNFSGTQNDGRIQSQQNLVNGQTTTYAYDSLGRLSGATAPTAGAVPSWAQSYSYDGWGNRTLPGALDFNGLTNRATTLGYDANGNTTSLPGTGTMAYDVANRMGSATVAGGTDSYAYEPDNLRVYRRKSGQNTADYYFYAPGGQMLGKYTVTNGSRAWTMANSNAWFGRKPLLANGQAVMHDARGSVMSGGPGDTVPAGGYEFAPYGEPLASTPGSLDRIQFATYWRDTTTGMDYARQRYYNSVHGRFMAPDPSGRSMRPGSPQSWNRYSYAGNDPVNRTDPSGLVDDDYYDNGGVYSSAEEGFGYDFGGGGYDFGFYGDSGGDYYPSDPGVYIDSFGNQAITISGTADPVPYDPAPTPSIQAPSIDASGDFYFVDGRSTGIPTYKTGLERIRALTY